MIHLIIQGDPKGKDRPRFGNGRTFTPKATQIAEAVIVAAWEDAGSPRLPDDTAIELEVRLVVTRPGGHFKRGGALSAEGLRNPQPMKQKPDVDNAVKLVMDALNKRAYRDDVRITRVLVTREWGDWPQTEITLRPLIELPQVA